METLAVRLSMSTDIADTKAFPLVDDLFRLNSILIGSSTGCGCLEYPERVVDKEGKIDERKGGGEFN